MTSETIGNSAGHPGGLRPALPLRQCLPDEGLGNLPEGSRVLIVRLRSMGDTILLTPALRMLHEWRPDLRVSVLLERPWHELLAGNPAVDQVLISETKLETLARIRRGRFAAVVNLHGGPTSAQLTRLSGARLRIGLAQFRWPGAYNVLVPRMQDILSRGPKSEPLSFHTAEHAAAIFGWLGMPLGLIPAARLFPGARDSEELNSLLRAASVPAGAEYALLHPAGLYPSKRWAARSYATVGNWLAARHQLSIVLLGAQGDLPLLKEVQSHMGPAVGLAAGWAIGKMLALIERARVFLGNDSGPAHAAAALAVPTAVIFGSSSSALWGPWRSRRSTVIQNEFSCNPCSGDRCAVYDSPRCIESISTEQVCSALEVLLAKRD